MIEVQSQLIICRGHIGASKGALQIFYGWQFYDKIDVKVKFCTFVFVSAAIWKGCKWIKRSKIISVVNLNMVYQIPVWKHDNFYLRDHRSKKRTFLGIKVKKCYLWLDNPHLHTKPNLNKCRKVQRSQIFKHNRSILIRSGFIAYLVIANGHLHGGIHVYHV